MSTIQVYIDFYIKYIFLVKFYEWKKLELRYSKNKKLSFYSKGCY